MLPKGEATKVNYPVHFAPVPEGMPMIFEPNGDCELSEGLELGEELTKITLGKSSHITILVRNNTGRNRVHMVKFYRFKTLQTKSTPKKRRNRILELPHIKVMNKMNGSHQLT